MGASMGTSCIGIRTLPCTGATAREDVGSWFGTSGKLSREELERVLSGELDVAGNPKWGNDLARVVWPTVSAYVLNLIIEQLEPSLTAIPALSTLQFVKEKSSLGDSPVQWTDIWIQMDPYSGLGGNRSLVLKGVLAWPGDLAIRLKIHGINLGIRNLKVDGLMYLELAGMRPDLPLFDGVRFYFIEPPQIHLDFTGVTRVMDIMKPLKTTVLEVVSKHVSNTLVLPYSFGFSIEKLLYPKADSFKVTNPKLEGIMWLCVWKACDLIPMDQYVMRQSSSDPYLQVRLGALQYRSQTVKRTLSPVFDFQVPLLVSLSREQSVYLTVFDEDQGTFQTSSDFEGSVAFPIQEMQNWSPGFFREVQLRDQQNGTGKAGANGSLWVATCWQPFQAYPLSAPSVSHAQVFAGVVEAHNLAYGTYAGRPFWVSVSCSNLLGTAQQSAEARSTAISMPTLVAELQEAQAQRVEDKIRKLKAYKLPNAEIANVLELAPEVVEKVVSGDLAQPLSDLLEEHRGGFCRVVWEAGFTFLVESPLLAEVSFVLMCRSSKGDEENIGSAKLQLSEVIGRGRVDGTHRFYDTKLGFKDSDIKLTIQLSLGYFGSSSVESSSPN
eukprot:TRINITY_DN33563_c0_g1_i1.p1 TRINITY_DN33563_c0_g1~~TRINITY_DN33563_c0_g1_i1.p1  ORF type:complete len:608 (-),score=92.09 TRINITY_DN33563_c0_g1_i1:83-1906(-)